MKQTNIQANEREIKLSFETEKFQRCSELSQFLKLKAPARGNKLVTQLFLSEIIIGILHFKVILSLSRPSKRT